MWATSGFSIGKTSCWSEPDELWEISQGLRYLPSSQRKGQRAGWPLCCYMRGIPLTYRLTATPRKAAGGDTSPLRKHIRASRCNDHRGVSVHGSSSDG